MSVRYHYSFHSTSVYSVRLELLVGIRHVKANCVASHCGPVLVEACLEGSTRCLKANKVYYDSTKWVVCVHWLLSYYCLDFCCLSFEEKVMQIYRNFLSLMARIWSSNQPFDLWKLSAKITVWILFLVQR